MLLVVDDEDDVREMVTALLEEEGYNVASARDGAEALDLLGRGLAPDLMLLDWMMPRMNGAEVLSALGSTLSRPAVIVFTAGTMPVLSGVPALPKTCGTRMLLRAIDAALSAIR